MPLSAASKKYLADFLNPVREAVEEAAVRTAGEIFIQAVQLTTVDSARAAYNWKIDFHGTDQFDMSQNSPPVGKSRSSAEERSSNAAAVMTAQMSRLGQLLASNDFVDKVYVYNPIAEGPYQGNAMLFNPLVETITSSDFTAMAEAHVKAHYPGMFA